MLGQFLHDAASRGIIQDRRFKKFHLGEFGHLDFWKQYAEADHHVREGSDSETHVDHICIFRFYFQVNPHQPSDAPIRTSQRTDSGEPPNVASSQIQTLSSDSNQLAI